MSKIVLFELWVNGEKRLTSTHEGKVRLRARQELRANPEAAVQILTVREG